MYDLKVYAARKDGVIRVVLSGCLANSFHTAAVVDKYPGGGRYYIVDPGTALVFIQETIEPGSDRCMVLRVPWFATVSIHDTTHNQVSIIVNDAVVLTADISNAEPEAYRVVALPASPGGANVACSVIPSGAPYLAIYSSVYGPASKAACEEWLCQTLGGDAFPMSASAGSGDKPFPW